MPTNYRSAVRKSLVAKLALYLTNRSRNMAEFTTLTLTNGQLQFVYIDPKTAGTTDYLIAWKQRGEPFAYPGVNVQFLNEVDQSTDRIAFKRYALPVKITICRELEPTRNPISLADELLNIQQLILECLSDSKVEIWDYTYAPSALFTEHKGIWYWDTRVTFSDESIAVDGGDLRFSLNFQINYQDFSYLQEQVDE